MSITFEKVKHNGKNKIENYSESFDLDLHDNAKFVSI